MDLRDEEQRLIEEISAWLRGFESESPVVVVPLFNAYEDSLECIESLVKHTPSSIPILVLDDASTDDRVQRTLTILAADQGFMYRRKASNSGFGPTVNSAFAAGGRRDVVVVHSDILVPAGWLERLQAAAYLHTTIATATPWTNHGSIVSVPYRNRPIPNLVNDLTLEEVDRRIKETSLLLRPIIPALVGHCTYFKRQVIDIIGMFDPTFAPGCGEGDDFSERAVGVGLRHVVADELFVFHKGSRSFESMDIERKARLQQEHAEIINERYPWFADWMREATESLQSPLAMAVERARAALLGYRILIDATCVNGSITGTQVGTLELIYALARRERHYHLAVLIGDSAPRESLRGIDHLVDEVVRVAELQSMEQPRFDLVHRPFQIYALHDLDLLRTIASRFIFSQLDCIGYANPSYWVTLDEWLEYRQVTQFAFAAADGIAFNSRDVLQDATQHGLHIAPERAFIAYNGVDHRLHSASAKPPKQAGAFKDRPFLLIIGTNYKHKNRVYGLKLLKVLVETYQWTGCLVFAGHEVMWGGSEREELLERLNSPTLRSRMHDLGVISEEEKSWLLAEAGLVLYPSHYEGFGFIAFEAAAAGTPVLSSRSTALAEVLGDQVIYLDVRVHHIVNPECNSIDGKRLTTS